MFPPIQRLVLLLTISIAAIIMAIQGKVIFLIIASVLSVLLLWDYFVHETVPLALKRIQKDNYPGAVKALSYIRKPDRFKDAVKAKYYLAEGLIYHNDNDFKNAKTSLLKAVSYHFKDQNAYAMALLTLTDIFVIENNIYDAKKYFNRLEHLKVGMDLVPEIRKMQTYLSNK